MRRRRTAEYLLVLALAALTLLSSGCVWLGEALSKASATDAPAPAETEAPSPTAAPSPLENPVFAVFSDYNRLRSQGAKGLVDAAYDSDDGLARALLMDFLREESLLSRVFVTVGMLSRESADAAFTGSFTGAYSGSGELLTNGSFSYVFDSGDTIRGTVEGRIAIRCEITDGYVSYSIVLFRSTDSIIVRVVSRGETGVYELTADGFRYARGASALIKGDNLGGEFPSAEGLSYLYWSGGVLTAEEK
jgi:hypothetical protein